MNQQFYEVEFWKSLIQQKGRDGFLKIRMDDLKRNSDAYQGNFKPQGRVLEVGTGLFSQLEWLDRSNVTELVSIDPLQEKYLEIMKEYKMPQKNVRLMEGTGEKLPFMGGRFDTIICWNVIDHTLDPKKMAAQIKRVLTRNGTFYFSVNFDDKLSPAHYSLFTQDTVDSLFPKFKVKFVNKFRNPDFPQTLCYQVMVKI